MLLLLLPSRGAAACRGEGHQLAGGLVLSDGATTSTTLTTLPAQQLCRPAIASGALLVKTMVVVLVVLVLPSAIVVHHHLQTGATTGAGEALLQAEQTAGEL